VCRKRDSEEMRAASVLCLFPFSLFLSLFSHLDVRPIGAQVVRQRVVVIRELRETKREGMCVAL